MTNKDTKPTALDIAKWFVQKSIDENVRMDQIKLMKLVYIAQGITLATTNNRLFDEDIQATECGVIIQSLYDQFKHFGMDQIESVGDLYNDNN